MLLNLKYFEQQKCHGGHKQYFGAITQMYSYISIEFLQMVVQDDKSFMHINNKSKGPTILRPQIGLARDSVDNNMNILI